MASPDIDSPWLFITRESYGNFNLHAEEAHPANIFAEQDASISSVASSSSFVPKPPPLPCKFYKKPKKSSCLAEYRFVPKETKEVWDKLFREGHGADVYVFAEDTSRMLVHSNILGVASPVLNNILQESEVKNGKRCVRIPGVPFEAVYTFIRFLYSSYYEEEALKKFVLHLLVLSHCYSVPSLKRLCIFLLEQDWLTRENVIDVLQLARLCDAPRLSFLCIRMVVKDFKYISSTEGWRVMRRASRALEQELVEFVVEADSRKEERLQKMEERKVYLQLHEALEALLHICRDGCRTIGPSDKMLKGSEVICNFQACKGVESLVRHFSHCKLKVPGGCVHCKRMWQLLELHSRMCDEPDSCKVPLCRYFKEKIQQHGKKDEAKWRVLVSKVAAARNVLGLISFKRASPL